MYIVIDYNRGFMFIDILCVYGLNLEGIWNILCMY